MARRIKPKTHNKKSKKNKKKQTSSSNRMTPPPAVTFPEPSRESPDDSDSDDVEYGPESLSSYMREQVAELLLRDGSSIKDAQRILEYLNHPDHNPYDNKQTRR